MVTTLKERLVIAKAHRLKVLAGIIQAPPPAPVPTKLRNLRQALRHWQAAGFPLASRPVRRARAGICTACEHWRSGGNLGLGECRAPGCGCTRAKWWLATEACPLGKWAAVATSPAAASA